MHHTITSPQLRTRSRRAIALIAATTTAVAVALTGCTSARDVTSGRASAAPVDGGTLAVAMALDAAPNSVFATPDRNYPWVDNVFEPLVRLDPKSRKVQPVLATNVAVASDGMSAKIDLRQGVTFQTGTPFTADAVKFTIAKSIDPTNGDNLAFVAKQFTAVDVVSPLELKITFGKLLGDSFFDYLNQTDIVDPDTYAGLADGSKVVGTGPFSFGSWAPGAGFTLTKYDKYWDVKNVHLDKIGYVVTTDPTAEINALKSGRAQLAFGMSAANAAAFSGNNSYKAVPGGGSIYPLGLNITAAPLDNKAVRQAVAYAIDYKRINSQVFANTGTVTNLPWGVSEPGNSKELHSRYTYDPEQAKKLIAQAGAEGATVSITYNRSNAGVNGMYEIVANNLSAIGLKPVADGRDQPTFQAAQTNATIPQSFVTLHGQVGLSPATLVRGLPTLRANNAEHMATSEYQSLTDALVNATSDKERSAALTALSEYMLDQAFFLTIVQAPDAVVASTSVGGVDVTIRGLLLFKSAYVSR